MMQGREEARSEKKGTEKQDSHKLYDKVNATPNGILAGVGHYEIFHAVSCGHIILRARDAATEAKKSQDFRVGHLSYSSAHHAKKGLIRGTNGVHRIKAPCWHRSWCHYTR